MKNTAEDKQVICVLSEVLGAFAAKISVKMSKH